MRTFITFLLLTAVINVMAQMPVEVKVVDRPSSLGVQSAFEVVVPQAKTNDAIDLWKKTIIPGGLFKKNPKMEKQKDEWIVNNVVINDITSTPLNVFTQISSFPENIYIRIFLQSEGGFLGSAGSSPQTTMAANNFIRNYAVDLYKQAVEKELKQEQNKLSSLENNQNKLYRQNKSFNNKIEDARRNESELKGEARQNEMLKNYQDSIQYINLNPNDDKAREKLDKEIKSTEKDLNRSQRSQSKYERKVNKNLKDQRGKADEIEKQKLHVREIKIKLENIR